MVLGVGSKSGGTEQPPHSPLGRVHTSRCVPARPSVVSAYEGSASVRRGGAPPSKSPPRMGGDFQIDLLPRWGLLELRRA